MRRASFNLTPLCTLSYLAHVLINSCFALPQHPAFDFPSNTSISVAPAQLAFHVCKTLEAQLNSTIVQLFAEEDFDTVARGAWNLFNTYSQPACVVVPRDASHVQVAMKAIYESGGVRYAVQAGGHSAMRGWNTVGNEGVLISFMHMKDVSYDAEKDTITLQPGVRWGEAISQLEPHGVAPLGGRLPDVGTGLLLGGGLSYLSAAHGFSVDSLVEADVVLVNGDKVTATGTNQYADLFRALKGGANRFGIVTRYEVRAIHVGRNEDKRFWGGSLVFDDSTSEGLMRATANYINNVEDPGTSLLVVFGVTFSNTTAESVNVITFFYNGTGDPTKIYSEFLSLPTTYALVSNFSYLEANHILGNGDERGFGQMFGASAFGSEEYDRATSGLSPEGNFARYMNAFDKFQEFVEKVRAVPPVTTTPSTSDAEISSYAPYPTSFFPSFPAPSMPTTPGPKPSMPAGPGKDPKDPKPVKPWPIFPGPIFPGPWPGPPTSTDAGISTALIAFSPVLKSQIRIGRERGGNSIDPPMANYHLVQFHVSTLPGFNTDLARVQSARSAFLKGLTPSPGIPLYMNECDETQPVFSTYGQYHALKQTYAKYDPTRFNMRFTMGPMGL